MQEQPKEQKQPKGPNTKFMINSLQNQVAESAYKIAEGEAIMGEMAMKIQELEKDNKALRESIAGKEKENKTESKGNAK